VTLHAEMTAIRQACAELGSWRLDDCDLYVTLEPCVMCAGAIIQARVRRLVFAAADPKAGAAGSITDIFSLPHNHRVDVSQGVMATESSELIREFSTVCARRTGRRSRAVRRNRQKKPGRYNRPQIPAADNNHQIMKARPRRICQIRRRVTGRFCAASIALHTS
jgi:hypothetical protein